MAAWYKEPDYNGGGVTKNKAFEPDIKKGYGDVRKIAPLIAAGARLAAPAIAGVAAEAVKPVAQNLGQRASNQIDKKGITVPSPLGPKMKIGGDKKMLKEDNIDVLIRQQQELAKAGRKFEAARLAEKIGQLRSRQFDTPSVQSELATNKTWREGGQQNRFGHGRDYQKMEKTVTDASDKPTIASKNLVKRTLPASKGTAIGKKAIPGYYPDTSKHEEVNFNRRSELNKSLIKSIDGLIKEMDKLDDAQKRKIRQDKVTEAAKKGKNINPNSKEYVNSPNYKFANKRIAKAIDSFLMRKGIIQKTANKSSLPLGDYQKAGKPIKRMVNSRAVDVSPDVWSAGKKTIITKI